MSSSICYRLLFSCCIVFMCAVCDSVCVGLSLLPLCFRALDCLACMMLVFECFRGTLHVLCVWLFSLCLVFLMVAFECLRVVRSLFLLCLCVFHDVLSFVLSV